MAVKITKLANGILFDTTDLPGTGIAFAKKMFRPLNYPSIETIALWSDNVRGTSANGTDFNMTLNGADGSYPISQIEGEAVVSIDDLFNKFIATL